MTPPPPHPPHPHRDPARSTTSPGTLPRPRAAGRQAPRRGATQAARPLRSRRCRTCLPPTPWPGCSGARQSSGSGSTSTSVRGRHQQLVGAGREGGLREARRGRPWGGQVGLAAPTGATGYGSRPLGAATRVCCVTQVQVSVRWGRALGQGLGGPCSASLHAWQAGLGRHLATSQADFLPFDFLPRLGPRPPPPRPPPPPTAPGPPAPRPHPAPTTAPGPPPPRAPGTGTGGAPGMGGGAGHGRGRRARAGHGHGRGAGHGHGRGAGHGHGHISWQSCGAPFGVRAATFVKVSRQKTLRP
jgi:hypothetical protein